MRYIRIIIAFIAILLCSFAPPVNAASFFNSTNNILYYDKDADGVSCRNIGGGKISQNIPSEWQKIFSSSAAKFSVNPNFLATLYLSEQANTWYSVTKTDWASNPSSGASGPMQFVPGTWRAFAEDGNGDGIKDIMNVEDAVFAAGKLAKAVGTDQTTPLGSTGTPLKNPSLLRGAASYNWGDGNVAGAGQEAPLSKLPSQTQEYVKNVYTLINSDFTKSGTPNYKDPIVSPGASQDTPSASLCGDGGLGMIEGFAFPLLTTQKTVISNEPYPWCYKVPTNCHHDYNAADLMSKTGTRVVAATDGVVEMVKDSSQFPSAVGSRITIRGADGILWYYAHMGRGTLAVSTGKSIKAGEEIGRVGTSADAQGTDPHLHLDALPKSYSSRPGCSSAECKSYEFIDIQPLLIKAFKELPS